MGSAASILVFGASWCAPCIAELPWLTELHERLESRGVTTVFIAVEETAAGRKEMARLAKTVPFRMTIDDGTLADRYGVKSFPSHFVLDADEAIVWEQSGLKATTRKDLEAAIEKLLAPAVTGDREEEVTFEEEIDRDTLKSLPPLPEHRTSRWLLLLPISCALLVAWNVDWRQTGRRTRKELRR